MEKKKRIVKIVIPIMVGIILLLGVGYAWFVLVLNGNKINVIKTGNLSLILGEEGNTILLENAFPIITDEGLQSEGYTFEVKNDGNLTSQYTLYFDDDTLEANEERIDPKYIRYSLEKDNAVVTENGSMLLSTLKNNELIKGIISPKQTHKYKLKLWVDNEADEGAMNKAFRRKLRIEAEILEVDGSCFVTNGSAITKYNTKDSEGNDCPKDVVIPGRIRGTTITGIGASAFTSKGLTSVVIPNTVTSIGTSAFRDNQMSDEEAFIYNRNSDGSVDYTSLNSYAGANRDNVVFPSNIKTIGSYSCNGLGLTSITLPEGLVSIQTASFTGNQLTKLKIPNTVISLNGNAFSNNQLSDEDAFIYRRTSSGEDRSYLITYAGAKRDNIIIPNNVKTIGSGAFLSGRINSVTIPNSVISIGERAFAGNNLMTISIPSSVVSIGAGAFTANRFTNEEDAYIYNRNSDGSIDYTSLNSYAGSNEITIVPSNITKLGPLSFLNNYELKEVILPETIETIGSSAFSGSLINSIIIPSNVISIDSGALNMRTLKRVINKTKRSFDWGKIINGTSGYNFITGTVGRNTGNVEVTSE